MIISATKQSKWSLYNLKKSDDTGEMYIIVESIDNYVL